MHIFSMFDYAHVTEIAKKVAKNSQLETSCQPGLATRVSN